MTGVSTYRFKGARFFSDREENSSGSDDLMYTMNHLHRGNFQKTAEKCIQITQISLSANHHSRLGCVDPGKCHIHDVSPKDGYFVHHRIGWKVSDECKDGKCVKYDPIVLKYKTKLETNMKYVLANIFP